MSVIDIVLAALLLFGLVRGFMKGLFVEIASLVALVAGVYGAIHFSHFVGSFLENKTEWSEQTINITAFAITFVVIIVVISIAGKALTKLASFAALGILNRLLGAVFGVLKVGLILSILLIVFNTMNSTLPFLSKEELEDSLLYEPVKSLAPLVLPSIIKAEADDLFEEEEEEVKPEETLEPEDITEIS